MRRFIFYLTLIFIVSCKQVPDDVKISGIVIYNDSSSGERIPEKFNDVYVVSKSGPNKELYQDLFYLGNALAINKSLCRSAELQETKDFDRLKARVDTISNDMVPGIIQAKSDTLTIKLMTDKNGEFSVLLKPGEYYFIANSKYEYAINAVECYGLVEIEPVTVKPKEEKQVVLEFN